MQLAPTDHLGFFRGVHAPAPRPTSMPEPTRPCPMGPKAPAPAHRPGLGCPGELLSHGAGHLRSAARAVLALPGAEAPILGANSPMRTG